MSPAPQHQRILLTGGTGFVGSYLAPALARAYPRAERVLLRPPGQQAERADWEVLEADIEDGQALSRALKKLQPDLILHLAAQASVIDGANAREATWRVNFLGSMELAGAVARHCPSATFLFVSSSEVYGASFNEGPAHEETPLRPSNVYARTKAAAESMLSDVLRSDQRLIVARPFNHTGPGQDRRFALPSFAAQIAEIEAGLRPPRLEVGNLEPMRDFLDVRDVCAAYLALLQTPSEARATFNIASGQAWSMRALLDILRGEARADFEIAIDPDRVRPSDIPRAVGNGEKIQKIAGWGPKIALEETLDQLLAFWRDKFANGARA